MKLFGFVILHYLVYEETVCCVDSVLNTLGDKNIVIVVVDNASPNKSGEKLSAKYKDEERVHVLLNAENRGFAEGNNAGYRYLKEKFSPDFITVMNNDTVISQKDFTERTEEVYNSSGFYVLGPDITNTGSGIHPNPRVLDYSLETMRKKKRRFGIRLKFPHVCFFFEKTLQKLSEKKRARKDAVTHGEDKRVFVEADGLHGSCLIFGPDYISKREYCLCPDTFLFLEEEILAYECRKYGYKMVYSPLLKIDHHCDVSSDAAAGSSYKKYVNKCRRTLDSINVLISMYEK